MKNVKLESTSGRFFKKFKVDGIIGPKLQKIKLNYPILTQRDTDKCREYDAYDGDTNPGGEMGRDWWWVDSWKDINR